MPSLRRKLFSGTSYTLVSILSVQAISLITSVIYARVLGRETLGILAVFIQLSAAIVPLSNLGLGTVIAKLIPEYRRKNQAELEEVLSTSLVVSVVAGAIV